MVALIEYALIILIYEYGDRIIEIQGEGKSAGAKLQMAKLYLYQAVDIVTQKGKESVISL
jgi:hypothetical protein